MYTYRREIPINFDSSMEETAGVVLRSCFEGRESVLVQQPVLARIVSGMIEETWPDIRYTLMRAGVNEEGLARMGQALLVEAWNQTISGVLGKDRVVKPVKTSALKIETYIRGEMRRQ